MIGIVYSKQDPAGANMAEYLIRNHDFNQIEGSEYVTYENKYAKIYEIAVSPVQADFVDLFKCDLVFFLSQHKSEASIGSFTTHSLGNWGKEAMVGGKPKQLSHAAPAAMFAALVNLNKIDAEVEKTYEATHHGPLLATPSLFVELGGNEEAIRDKDRAAKVAEAAYNAVLDAKNGEAACNKIVIGIGSTHYPEKFSRLALEKGYAFSHIMPKYAILNEDGTNNLDMLEQTLERSTHKPEAAVIDWKSLNAVTKEETIGKLEEIGLDYEKI